jgi:hypothetical protein
LAKQQHSIVFVHKLSHGGVVMRGAVFAVLAGVRVLVAPASFQFVSFGELSRNRMCGIF